MRRIFFAFVSLLSIFYPAHEMKDPIKPMSPEFFDAWKFAAEESDRLGLTITSQCGPGWCHSGGPWIQPDQAIQHIAFSEIKVAIGINQRLKLLLTYPGREINRQRDKIN